MPLRHVFQPAILAGVMAVATAGNVAAQAIERSMYVSVVDDAGAPVPGLRPSDFIVREDDVAREVLRVAPAIEPMQIEILVDNSQAADSYIRDIRTALTEFVDALAAPNEGGERNEVGLVALGDRPTILTASTFDAGQLKKGIARMFSRAETGNYLLDGIVEVCRGFAKRDARRPVIVAITTEGPELSSQHFERVLEPLRETRAQFHVVVIGRLSDDSSDEAQHRRIVLDQGPATTGGRSEHILTSMALRGKLTQLAAELKAQYRVTYARPQTLLQPEKTTVRAAKPGLTARGSVVKERQGGR